VTTQPPPIEVVYLSLIEAPEEDLDPMGYNRLRRMRSSLGVSESTFQHGNSATQEWARVVRWQSGPSITTGWDYSTWRPGVDENGQARVGFNIPLSTTGVAGVPDGETYQAFYRVVVRHVRGETVLSESVGDPWELTSTGEHSADGALYLPMWEDGEHAWERGDELHLELQIISNAFQRTNFDTREGISFIEVWEGYEEEEHFQTHIATDVRGDTPDTGSSRDFLSVESPQGSPTTITETFTTSVSLEPRVLFVTPPISSSFMREMAVASLDGEIRVKGKVTAGIDFRGSGTRQLRVRRRSYSSGLFLDNWESGESVASISSSVEAREFDVVFGPVSHGSQPQTSIEYLYVELWASNNQGNNITVTAEVNDEEKTAFSFEIVGPAGVIVEIPLMVASASALDPVVDAEIVLDTSAEALTSSATAKALDPQIETQWNNAVSVTTAGSSASSPSPEIFTEFFFGVTVENPTASASAEALEPGVVTTKSTSVSIPPSSASASSSAPTVAAQKQTTVSVGSATSTASMEAPTARAEIHRSVSVPISSAQASSSAPTVTTQFFDEWTEVDVGDADPWLLENLNFGAEYEVQVLAYNLAGESDWSESEYGTTASFLPKASATARALAPAVYTEELFPDVQVSVGAAQATASALAPSVRVDNLAEALRASATASALPPVVRVQKTAQIAVETASASSGAIPASVVLSKSVSITSAGSTAQALTPTIYTGRHAEVSAPVAVSNAAALDPQVSAATNVWIGVPPSTSDAGALDPEVLTNFNAFVVPSPARAEARGLSIVLILEGTTRIPILPASASARLLVPATNGIVVARYVVLFTNLRTSASLGSPTQTLVLPLSDSSATLGSSRQDLEVPNKSTEAFMDRNQEHRT